MRLTLPLYSIIELSHQLIITFCSFHSPSFQFSVFAPEYPNILITSSAQNPNNIFLQTYIVFFVTAKPSEQTVHTMERKLHFSL